MALRKYKYGQPTAVLVVEAVKAYDGFATLSQIDSYLKSTILNYNDNTAANLLATSVNCARSHWSFNKTQRRSDDETHRHHKYDQLFKRGNVYELYQPALHGVWELYRDEQGKWYSRQIETLDEAQRLHMKFHEEVKIASKLTSVERQKFLASANKIPEVKEVITKIFIRNANVVAEVLQRAEGKCEICKRDAPFVRGKDGTPYLEVHHNIPLSKGGQDTIENAVAICPNCHRQAHFG